MITDDHAAFWLSRANPMFAEVAAAKGFRRILLDLEHGVFDQAEVDGFFPLCRALGLDVVAKVAAPEPAAIRQALDFGADAVVIPHIQDRGHAARVTAAAKYPPLGNRSYSSGRIVGYGGMPAGFPAVENRRVRCLPMIESAAALADVTEIAALPTVDGLFVGPTDLALSRGRGRYDFDDADRADIARIAEAARAAGKPWIMPAWSAAERAFSRAHGVGWMVTVSDYAVVLEGFATAIDRIAREVAT